MKKRRVLDAVSSDIALAHLNNLHFQQLFPLHTENMKAIHPLLLTIALTGVGQAASIVQVQPYSYVPTNTAALTFNKFNSALGTLTSIVITTNVTKSGGSLFVDNESGTGATGNISQSVSITLASGTVSLVDGSLQPIGSNITATSTYLASVTADNGDGPGVQSDLPGNDYDGTTFGSVSNSQTKSVISAAWGGYTGVGTFVIDVNGVQGFNTTAIGGAAVAIDPATASGDVTITYNYEAVPEPSSVLLGGLGLLGLLRRRR
jgi:hypothetical protein